MSDPTPTPDAHDATGGYLRCAICGQSECAPVHPTGHEYLALGPHERWAKPAFHGETFLQKQRRHFDDHDD